ncbi:hypothetical protein JTB14_023097 [Gonioctena quinquepunctata]|nr:hypothetical protein JTB14_023097 [Gonioctena quinquepunctata]
MSKKSKGLFRASMMQSATPLNCWSLQKHPEIAANKYVASLKWNSKLLGALLGHKNTPSEEALKILQKASVANLKKSSDITLQIPLDKKNCHSFTSLIWPPVYENDRNEDALVTGMNHENIKNGNINKVPILIGINSEESLLFGANEIRLQCSLLDVNQPAIVSQNMNLENGNRTPAGRSIKRMYTQSLFAFSTAASLNFASDMLFATPVARHAYLQSKYTDVFFYQFSHLGKLGRLVESDVEGARGVGHQEEIEYLFRTNNNKDLTQFPAEDVLTHDRLVELWSQFIKYMNPTEKRTDILQDPKKYREYSAIYSQYAENRLDTY